MIPPSGTIALFWGLLAAIPTGWKSCDGTLGTPDLRDKFILGAGGHEAPHNTGGASSHNHDFTSDTHTHQQPAGTDYAAGADWNKITNTAVLTGTTNNATMLPPYFALIYVQKI